MEMIQHGKYAPSLRRSFLLTALGALLLLVTRHAEAVSTSTDSISYLDNGIIRLGVNLDLGGAITWLSASGSTNNLINSFDWGRQIQMSHYSGPVPFAPNGKQPRNEWAGLGWNPIQSGDSFGNRSKVVIQRNDGHELYVKCIPMQWPLNNEPGECSFECWIHLEDNTVLVRSRLENHRVDKTQYQGRDQELPALYTCGPWWRLMTYTNDLPFSGGALSQMPAQMPWTQWHATENWAALVDNNNWGVGLWEPGVYKFCGGFAGNPGAGGPKDNPTGYIAPLHVEILDANIDYPFSYVLIVGKLEQIRSYVYQHSLKPTPPTYRFQKDRQHWVYCNATDTGWPIDGELKVWLDHDDPYLVGPAGFWQAAEAPKVYLEAAAQASQPKAALYWTRPGDLSFNERQKVNFDLVADGKFHVYEVDLSASPEYGGAITGLRLDPVPSGKTGEFIRLRSIGFTRASSSQR